MPSLGLEINQHHYFIIQRFIVEHETELEANKHVRQLVLNILLKHNRLQSSLAESAKTRD